jgi:hypothetical protein
MYDYNEDYCDICFQIHNYINILNCFICNKIVCDKCNYNFLICKKYKCIYTYKILDKLFEKDIAYNIIRLFNL